MSIAVIGSSVISEDPSPVRLWCVGGVPSAERHLHRYRFRVFGCDAEIVSAERPAVPLAQAAAELHALDVRLSRFRPDSELSLLNEAKGTPREVSPVLARLLASSLVASLASDGAVNVAVLPALERAGYRSRWPAPLEALPPEADESLRWGADPPAVPFLPAVLDLTGRRARLRPGTMVDLGALAKGVLAEATTRRLGGNACCCLGGDVHAAGPGPDGSGWPVGIPTGEVLLVRDASVATSGVGQRRWGPGLHHLIDPTTGLPSQSDVVRATAASDDPVMAEWLSTAAVVRGTPALFTLDRAPAWLWLETTAGGVRTAGAAAVNVRTDRLATRRAVPRAGWSLAGYISTEQMAPVR